MENKHIVYLIHGFNVKDNGAQTVDTIRSYFEFRGYRVCDIDYGYFHRMRVRLCNKGIAKAISSLVEPNSTCIAHSNGGALAWLACEYGAAFKNVILVNPALDSNKAIAKQVQKVQVWHHPCDKWTGISKYIPNSIWGAQGRTGYTGPEDDRYSNYNEEELFGKLEDEHSGIWHDENNRLIFAGVVEEMINKGA